MGETATKGEGLKTVTLAGGAVEMPFLASIVMGRAEGPPTPQPSHPLAAASRVASPTASMQR